MVCVRSLLKVDSSAGQGILWSYGTKKLISIFAESCHRLCPDPVETYTHSIF
jgi:hypothetical protein